MSPSDSLDVVMLAVCDEAERAQDKYGDFASAHEAYGVIAEEFDEFLDAVRLRQNDPNRPAAMREELIQIAAIAIRFAAQAERVTR